MRSEWKRFAPYGLYVAILAALVSGGLYFVNRIIDLNLQISLAFIVLGIAAFLILDPDSVRMAVTRRQAQYGSNALILILAILGILIVVNYLAYDNPQRWDLTEDRENTLAPETIDTLATLEQPVTALAFYSSRVSEASVDVARSMLENFSLNGEENFSYRIVDPNEEPVLAQELGITVDRTIALQMGDRVELVTSLGERQLVQGLIALLSNEGASVYFLTGHGERDVDGADDLSLSQARNTLEGKNYTVTSLNLFSLGEIPADADVIVVAGPQIPVRQEEVELLKGFVLAGGGLIVLTDPTLDTQIGDQEDPLAAYLASDWGIEIGNNLIVDVRSEYLTFAISNEYGNHPITQQLLDGVTLYFPNARSVSAGENIEGLTKTVLVSTAPFDISPSWAESDITSLLEGEPPEPDEDEDILGPVPMAVAAENADLEARIVVVGDSDFATNAFFLDQTNGDLLINAVDWVAGQENLISLTPRTFTQRLMIPPQPLYMNMIFLFGVILLPGGILVTGVVVWVLRRRRI